MCARRKRHIICVPRENARALALVPFPIPTRQPDERDPQSSEGALTRFRRSPSTDFPERAVARRKFRRWLLRAGPLLLGDFLAVFGTLLVVNLGLQVFGLSHFTLRVRSVFSFSAAVILAHAVFGLYQEGAYAPVVELRYR